jgi:hypothetical protein
LYGTLDAGLVYSNNQGGHSNWQQGSGSVSNTYFGLRGSEDLAAVCMPSSRWKTAST